jgi:hypothetical protein
MTRYGFTIRTRTGQRVDNISIIAGSQADAERRLRQMYLQCEITDRREQAVQRRLETLDVRRMIGMMSGVAPAAQKVGTH